MPTYLWTSIQIFKDSLTNSKILRIPAGVLNTMVFILKPQQVKPQQLQQPMFPEDPVDVCILERNQKKTYKVISYYFFNKKEHVFTLGVKFNALVQFDMYCFNSDGFLLEFILID